jgi:hypothetical protein
MDTEARITRLIEQRGPLTGAELQAALPTPAVAARSDPAGDAFDCWKAAVLSGRLVVRRVGTRFLRLDRKVEGFARLSPSILREFMTYSVVGLADDTPTLDRRAADVLAHAETVSRAKLELATGIVAGIAARIAEGGATDDRYCVFIAGDVVYGMAHDVPRPERSTGQMVRGSDLDLVVVVDDAAPGTLLSRLDEEIYQQKYRRLINPSAREEIDYIVKPLARLREQAQFDTFKKMVACKILQEGVLIYGSAQLFAAAKALLDEHGVAQKLLDMEAAAAHFRGRAEEHLLNTEGSILGADELHLFFTADESEEFE